LSAENQIIWKRNGKETKLGGSIGINESINVNNSEFDYDYTRLHFNPGMAEVPQ